MKQKCGLFVVATVAFISSVVGASAAYQSEYFNSSPGITWGGSSNIVTNTTLKVHEGAGSLVIPVLQWVTNGVTSLNISNQVWTDFWTVPVLFNSDGQTETPVVDTNATVLFYAKSNGYWVVISGNGGTGLVTNTLTTAINDPSYPLVPSNNTNFYNVSVLSDYSNKTFAFYVNGICLATNKHFIDTNVSSMCWFQTQNLGGTSNNVCYLDTYILTNRVTGLLTNPVEGSTLSEADALQYFGGVGNPVPSNTAVTVTNNVAAWTFETPITGASYQVIGSTNPTNNYVILSNAIAGGTNLIAYLGNGTNKYFEKVLAVSSVDSNVVATNTIVYAAYLQTRTKNRAYVLGIPVMPIGTNDTLAGPFGIQLAKGLANNDLLTTYIGTNVLVYKRVDGPSWDPQAGDVLPQNMHLTPGLGLLLQTGSNVGTETNTIFAGLLQTNTAVMALTTNRWNALAWPYETSGSFTNAIGGTPVGNSSTIGFALGDYAWIMIAGSPTPIPVRYVNNAWRKYFTTASGPLVGDLKLNAGDGIMYWASSNSTAIWQPQQQ